MDVSEEIERWKKVLEIDRKNNNLLFIENIEREIAALESGEISPIVQNYLNEEERT